MDIKDYISSGIVELYAMNALSPEDKKEFEQKLLMYSELVAELKKVQHGLENYAIAHARNPRPHLRAELLEKVYGTLSKEMKSPNVIPTDPAMHSLTYKYLIAASLAALVISTFASWFFYKSWNEAEERYTSLLKDKNELARNYNMVKNTFDQTVTELVIMRDENARIITLQSTDTSKNYVARVYWNQQSGQSFIDVLSLPEPGEGNQYQLWALVGGKPVDAGVFETGLNGIQQVKNVTAADMWAVTLEPEGGSVSPTLDKMYLISKSS
jgi:anti-sigma-K factor RskA